MYTSTILGKNIQIRRTRGFALSSNRHYANLSSNYYIQLYQLLCVYILTYYNATSYSIFDFNSRLLISSLVTLNQNQNPKIHISSGVFRMLSRGDISWKTKFPRRWEGTLTNVIKLTSKKNTKGEIYPPYPPRKYVTAY